jgi:hypothetical protein
MPRSGEDAGSSAFPGGRHYSTADDRGRAAITQGLNAAPCAGSVNPRRPQSGRSAAESIDDAEQGVMMSRVMAAALAHLQEHSPSNTTRNHSIVNCRTPFEFA